MAQEPPKPGARRRPSSILPSKLDELGPLLDQQFPDAAPILELLITAAARGQDSKLAWNQLHAAAVRHDKISELAFAYEHVLHERRIKLLPPDMQAEVYLHAVRFFNDFFGDTDGAVSYAERALAAVPGHPEAFGVLETLLSESEQPLRLAKLYADASAVERDKDQQLVFLGRAAELVDGQPGADELLIDICQRTLRVEPRATATRRTLEQRLTAAGRVREAARILEQAVMLDPPLSDEEAEPLRERLIGMYVHELGDPKQSITHVEALLARDPTHEGARQVAETLLENKAVAPRAIAALGDACERLGQLDRAAALLAQELRIVRGPRRIEVQRRLGILRQDVLGDPSGALELLGPVVAGDPGDDSLRRRFVELSESLGQPLEAARLLQRALASARDPAVRARVSAEIGALFARTGDAKAAQGAFQQVLEIGQDDGAMLQAAKHLAEMHAEARELDALGRTLELVVRLEPEREARQAAARRLARLCEGDLNDPVRAIPAYRALIGSPWTDEALRKLEALCEEANDVEGLIEALERRSERSRDPAEARSLAFRAAELRSTRTRDSAGALLAWRLLAQKYGASSEINARLIPLLEQAGEWDALLGLLDAEIRSAARPEERAALLAQAAQIRLGRTNDPAGALQLFRQALAIDPSETTSRSAVERLLAAREHRLLAAEILEPIYRREQDTSGLLRALDVRAGSDPDPIGRLRALKEACDLAETELHDAARALPLAGRALALVVETEPHDVRNWIERVRHVGASVDPTAHAEALADALGDRPVTSQDLMLLARHAADALVACGDIPRAIDLLRRALAYEHSADLVGRIDELLAQQGSPEDRLTLYRDALDKEGDRARRRELLHAIATVQRRDLHDAAAALETWREVAAEDPRDLTAHHALLATYEEAQDWEAAYGELVRVLPHLEGERRSVTLLRMAEISAEHGQPQRALTHYRELMESAELADDVLESIEQLARERDDAATTRAVLVRRLAGASSADRRAALLERLGNVLSWQLDDSNAAAEAWLEGARLSEAGTADPERARRLYERVLGALPDHREAAERLIDLHAAAGEWASLLEPLEALLRLAPEDAIRTVVQLEQPVTAAGAIEPFVSLLDAALAIRPGAAHARRLALIKARALAQLAERHDDAAHIYRALLESDGDDETAVAEAFELFLRDAPAEPHRIEDRRWLYAWRAERSADPATVLHTWAVAEEQEFGDPTAAVALYERVIAIDPERSDALTQLARLRSARGDAEGALGNLEVLRERSAGEARNAVERAMAILLIEQLGRPQDALAVIKPLLSAVPPDGEVLRVVHGALAYPETRNEAAGLLERVAENSDDPQARLRTLERLLEVSNGVAELAEARSRWTKRVLEARADDPEATFAVALQAAEQIVTDNELWDIAEKCARRLNRPAPVGEAYSRAIMSDLPAESAEALGRRVVEFHEEWFDAPDRVVELLERVLVLSPGASWALDRLKLAFNAAGRWTELFGLYDRALEHASGATRVELLREAAMAARDFAGEGERAIGYLEQLDQASPGDTRVDASLERLYERHRRTRPLIALLERRLEHAQGSARRDLRSRIAALYLDIGEVLPAFDLSEALLADDRDAADTIALLERLIATPAAKDSIPPPPADASTKKARKAKAAAAQTVASVRDRAASHLKRHYEGAGKTADVVRMLEIEVEVAPTAEDRRARLGAIVAMRLDDLGDLEGAFQSLSELVRLAPGEPDHRTRLAAVADRIGAADRRADLLTSVAAAAADSSLRAELLLEAAGVHQRLLAAPERATQLYFEVLNLADSAKTPALSAARELDALLESAGRAKERCSVLEQLAKLEGDREARKRALGNAALVASQTLADPDRAVRAWRARLHDDEQDAEALDGLCAGLEAAGRWDELVRALERRAGSAERAAAQRDRVSIARIHAERRGDRAAAIEAWRGVRQSYGPDLENSDALAALLDSEQRFDELARHLAEEGGREQESLRRSDLYRRLGEVLRDKLGDPLRALNAFVWAGDWNRAIEVAGATGHDPERGLEVCRSLLEVAVDAWQKDTNSGSGPETAAGWAIDELGARLRELGRFADLVELLLGAARLPLTRRRARELKREAACLYSDRLDDVGRAIETFQELFREDAGDDVATASVTRLALLLEEQGRLPELVALWEEQARARASGGDAAAGAALWARAAHIAEEQLNDLERAIADHREGAGLGGEDSLEALARIYEARGESRRAAEVLEWLTHQSSGDRLGDRALRLAEAYLASGDRRRARARLEAAAVEAIDATAVRKRLAELYRQSEEFGPLAELLALEATRAPDKKRRVELLREAASLHGDRRDDPAAAVPLLEQAVDADPDDPMLRLSLADVLRRAGRLEQAKATLEAQIERYGSRRPKDRALVHLSMARVALAAGDSGQALAELEIATRIDPAHSGILELTAELAFERDELDRAERVYRALLLVIGRDGGDGPSRAEALLALSEIAGRRNDSVRAQEFIESAFEAAFDSEREAQCLEKALQRRGKTELINRAVELRLKSATEPGRAARALADFVFLHKTPADVPASLLERAHAIERDLEQRGPDDFGAWTALGKVYDWLGDREAEARILERRVGSLPSIATPEDADPLYRLAGLRLADPARREQGLTLLERALELRADPSRTADILRAAFGDEPSDERAVRLLERVARATGDQLALANALSLRVRQPGGADAQALREAVELALELGERDLAESVLRIGIRSDVVLPADAAAWARLELAALRRASGAIDEALDLREQAAGFLGGEGRGALVDVARESAAANDFTRAVRIYEQLLAHEPGDREIWEPLLDLHRRRGERERLIALIEQTVPLVDGSDERARLKLEQANALLEDPSRADAATSILRQVLDEDPTQPTASTLLAGIFEKAGRLDDLAALLLSQLDAAKDRQDVESIVAISLRLAELFERQGKRAEALETYRGAIDWDGRSRAALEALLRLGDALNDGLVVADALTGLLDAGAIEDPEGAAFRLAALRREQEDTAGVERALVLGFGAVPASAALREALLELYQARGDNAAASALLRRAVDAAPADNELITRMVAAHRASEEQEVALEVINRLLSQAPAAQLYRERATLLAELARDDDALADLERSHALGGDQPQLLVEALERAIARAEPPQDATLTLRLTQIFEDIGDYDGARARLAELVKQSPSDKQALERLIALERRAENWDNACTLLLQRAAAESGPDLLPIALELADVCERASRLPDARRALERALEVEPRNPGLRQRLRAVYAATSATAELARLLIEDAEYETDTARRHASLLSAGELLLGGDGDADSAIHILTQAREVNPDSVEGSVLLARAYAAADQSAPALDLLGAVILAHRGRRSKQLSLVYQEISSIQLMQGFLSEAMDSLTKAFEMDVRNGQLAMQLAQLALDIDEEETALRAFRSVTMMKPADGDPSDGATAEAKAEAHFQLARIALKRGDPRKAKVLVAKALAENPQLEPARLFLHDLESAERRA